MTTNSTLVNSWEDEDENDGEWPYPTQYNQYRIEGDLADRVNRRMGNDPGTEVLLTETVVSGGWSEYTQENDYSHEIEAGGETVELVGTWQSNPIAALVKWLGEEN